MWYLGWAAVVIFYAKLVAVKVVTPVIAPDNRKLVKIPTEVISGWDTAVH
jgi:hypothetical protein